MHWFAECFLKPDATRIAFLPRNVQVNPVQLQFRPQSETK